MWFSVEKEFILYLFEISLVDPLTLIIVLSLFNSYINISSKKFSSTPFHLLFVILYSWPSYGLTPVLPDYLLLRHSCIGIRHQSFDRVKMQCLGPQFLTKNIKEERPLGLYSIYNTNNTILILILLIIVKIIIFIIRIILFFILILLSIVKIILFITPIIIFLILILLIIVKIIIFITKIILFLILILLIIIKIIIFITQIILFFILILLIIIKK
jgi:hypothetical protein